MLKFQQNLEDQLLSRPAPRFWKSLQSILDDEGGGKLFFYSVASACVSGLAAYVFYQHQGAAAVSDSLHVLSDYVGTLADLTSPKLKEVQVTVLPQAYDHIKMGIDTLVSHLPDKAYLLSSVDSLKNGMNSSNSSSLLSSMDEVLENTDGYSSYFSPKLISGLFGAISALTGGVFFSAARDDYKHKKRGFENEHSHHHKLLEEANDDYERIEDADSKRKIRHLINKKLDLIESTPRSFERLLCEYRDLCLSARSNTFDRTYDRIKNGDSYTGVKI